jgi:hypothetical protein
MAIACPGERIQFHHLIVFFEKFEPLSPRLNVMIASQSISPLFRIIPIFLPPGHWMRSISSPKYEIISVSSTTHFSFLKQRPSTNFFTKSMTIIVASRHLADAMTVLFNRFLSKSSIPLQRKPLANDTLKKFTHHRP